MPGSLCSLCTALGSSASQPVHYCVRKYPVFFLCYMHGQHWQVCGFISFPLRSSIHVCILSGRVRVFAGLGCSDELRLLSLFYALLMSDVVAIDWL